MHFVPGLGVKQSVGRNKDFSVQHLAIQWAAQQIVGAELLIAAFIDGWLGHNRSGD
jgi:hypothetical protein